MSQFFFFDRLKITNAEDVRRILRQLDFIIYDWLDRKNARDMKEEQMFTMSQLRQNTYIKSIFKKCTYKNNKQNREQEEEQVQKSQYYHKKNKIRMDAIDDEDYRALKKRKYSMGFPTMGMDMTSSEEEDWWNSNLK